MYYIVPNWNLNFEPIKFNNEKDLLNYADLNNILVTLVSDNKYHCKKHNILFNSVIYVGW